MRSDGSPFYCMGRGIETCRSTLFSRPQLSATVLPFGMAVSKAVLCGKRNTAASFLKHELPFRGHGRRIVLETSIFILRSMRTNLRL